MIFKRIKIEDKMKRNRNFQHNEVVDEQWNNQCEIETIQIDDSNSKKSRFRRTSLHNFFPTTRIVTCHFNVVDTSPKNILSGKCNQCNMIGFLSRCSYCEKYFCSNKCGGLCGHCQFNYCSFCSTIEYMGFGSERICANCT